MRSPKTRKKTAFVPRIIFQAAATVSVVPLCVVACGGAVLQSEGPGAGDVAVIAFDAGKDGLFFTVAAECFSDGAPCVADVASMAFDAGDAQLGVATDAFLGADVATIAFDGGDAQLGVALDAFSRDVLLGVATIGFDGGDARGVADGSSRDAILGVAIMAFDGGDAGKG